MGKPITTKSQGICFAFPDVCSTPAAPSPIPIPYPNIGQLSQVQDPTETVLVGGNPVVTSKSNIPTTTGDEAGTANGPTSFAGKVEFVTFSNTVFAEDGNVVRMFDTTKQNQGNAVGNVLSGIPTVLVGD